MRFAWVFSIFAVVVAAVSQQRPREPEVWVSLAIPRYGNAFSPPQPTPRRLSLNGPRDQFQVVIENRSPRPLEVFADGSSWGDGTLSFEITWPNGKRSIATRQVSGYSKNSPSTVRLDPGECCVRTVFFEQTSWVGFPKPTSGNPIRVSMRAILTQPRSEFKNEDLWSGRAVSSPMTVEWWGR